MLFGKNCCRPIPQFDRCCPDYNFVNQQYNACSDMNQTREQCVVEPTINKCVEKEFYHEVPQE